MTTQDEFIQQHEGNLTPELAAQLLELGEGDTGAHPEIESVPDAPAIEKEDAPEGGKETEANAAEGDAQNTVILARDGKHTIDYQKLVDAREGEKHWKAQAEEANRKLAELQAAAEARAENGQAPTNIDNQVAAAQAAIDAGADPDLFGDFSEEALAKGIATLVEQKTRAIAAQIEARLEEAVAPLQLKQVTDANTAHYQAIYSKHPDADSIVESKELTDWIASKPNFARAGYLAALEKGSANDVIELFDAFKTETGRTQNAAALPKGDAKAAAKAAIEKAAPVIPASLSDIPGGRSGAPSADEAMDGLSGIDLLEAMQEKGWSPKQIETYLNRRI